MNILARRVPQGKAAPRSDADESLAVRAAWLHYAGLTQTEVAARLNISAVKVHRLVAGRTGSGR